MASQQHLREKITAQIVAALESGNLPPWRRPWSLDKNAGFPANIVSKKPYRGINPILLDVASARHDLTSKWWGTFNQWKGLGGKVMRRPADVPEGQWGTTIVFWTPVTKTEKDAEGDEKTDRYFVMRSYTVFCFDQVEGHHLDHLRARHVWQQNLFEYSRRFGPFLHVIEGILPIKRLIGRLSGLAVLRLPQAKYPRVRADSHRRAIPAAQIEPMEESHAIPSEATLGPGPP